MQDAPVDEEPTGDYEMTPNSHHIAVALFVRHPVPGRVKTRLARDLGEEAACDLYRAMVTDLMVTITTCALPLYLFHDGQGAAGLPMEWRNAAVDTICQRGDSLGERMNAAFEYLFSIGRERVILTGSDIPGIDAQLLQSAIVSIEGYDIVFSPAFDGGYCLVASKQESFNNSIFREIPWSTADVLKTTLDKCRADGLSFALLDPRQDIDTLNDLKAYCKQPSPLAMYTNSWLESHGYLPSPLDD
jgi:rSAM/selenodomain-associated transferase 1